MKYKISIVYMFYLITITSCVLSDDTSNQSNKGDFSYPNYSTFYHNDFAINDFENIGSLNTPDSSVTISDGKLKINPGRAFGSIGRVSFNSPNLEDNTGKIIWAFNAAVEDGEFSNLFRFRISEYDPNTHGDQNYGIYMEVGSGQDNSDMHLSRLSRDSENTNSILEDYDGLDELPSIGSFKFVYDTDSKEWEFYFEQSTSLIDPLEISTLVATYSEVSVNNNTNLNLRLISFESRSSGGLYIDNFSILVSQ